MVNRSELNLETTEMVCGGRKATLAEIKKECGDNKFALQMVELCEEVHNLLNEIGFKHDFNLEINK